MELKNKMIKIVFYSEDRKGINPEDKFIEIEKEDLVNYDIQGIMTNAKGLPLESYTGRISKD